MKTPRAIFIGLLLAVAARESWGWLPCLSRVLIWVATAPLPRERRLIRREEWCAELTAEYDDRRVTGLAWSLKLVPVSLWERAITIDARGRLTAIRRWRRPSVETAVVGAAIAVSAVGISAISLAVLGRGLLTALAVGASSLIPDLLFFPWFAWYLRRRRRDAELAVRRLEVLKVLDAAAHDSYAASIVELRELQVSLISRHADAAFIDEDGHLVVVEAKRFAAA